MLAIHRAGVVHLDWYLSNFMWRCHPETKEIEVRIIDFDPAHFIADTLSDETASRLNATRLALAGEEEGGEGDVRNFDRSLMRLLRKHADAPELQSDDKGTLDHHFKEFQRQQVEVLSM